MPDRLPTRRPQSKRRLPNARGNRSERFSCGNNHNRQNETGQRQPPRQQTLSKMKLINKKSKGHQTIKNRRNPRQIRNIDLNKVGPSVFWRVLLKINPRGQPKGDRHSSCHQHQKKGSNPSGKNPSLSRSPRWKGSKKLPVDPRQTVNRQIEQKNSQNT